MINNRILLKKWEEIVKKIRFISNKFLVLITKNYKLDYFVARLVAEKVASSSLFTTFMRRRLFVILIIFVALDACGRTPYLAPVSEVAQPPPRKVSTHTVAQGETLYSIAWQYDLDYKSLAKANKIDSHFMIYPGQRLNLKVGPRKPWSPAEKPKKTSPSSTSIVKKNPARSKNETNSSVKNTIKPKVKQSPSWRWPLKGKILASFRTKNGLHKGIDIRGNLGEPVIAASSGTVVYSGDGLRAYGKLLIVKHSENFLSAYAHNRRLLVKEGDVVQAGQKIAEVGSTGTDSAKLYFEIRYNGKPVNPLRYLPKI